MYSPWGGSTVPRDQQEQEVVVPWGGRHGYGSLWSEEVAVEARDGGGCRGNGF